MQLVQGGQERADGGAEAASGKGDGAKRRGARDDAANAGAGRGGVELFRERARDGRAQSPATDATAAVGSLGFTNRVGDHLVAVENTERTHNMIVCTLCSCYPWEVLGLPPVWYKSAPYRSRAVIDPRGVLADFGVVVPATTEIRVWDSTAETRFLVLPMRPAGTDGWSEERLATLVTRDSMIGTSLARRPDEVTR